MNFLQMISLVFHIPQAQREEEVSSFCGNMAHRVFRQRRDRQARIHARIGGHNRAINHV